MNIIPFRFKLAMESQPTWPVLYENWILYLGYVLILLGSAFVFSSYYALGFYGTFLGRFYSNVFSSYYALGFYGTFLSRFCSNISLFLLFLA